MKIHPRHKNTVSHPALRAGILGSKFLREQAEQREAEQRMVAAIARGEVQMKLDHRTGKATFIRKHGDVTPTGARG